MSVPLAYYDEFENYRPKPSSDGYRKGYSDGYEDGLVEGLRQANKRNAMKTFFDRSSLYKTDEFELPPFMD